MSLLLQGHPKKFSSRADPTLAHSSLLAWLKICVQKSSASAAKSALNKKLKAFCERPAQTATAKLPVLNSVRVKYYTADTLFSPSVTAPATRLRCYSIMASILKPNPFLSAFVLNTHNPRSIAHASATKRDIRHWVPRNTNLSITAKMAAVSTVFVCAPAAPSLQPPPKKAV